MAQYDLTPFMTGMDKGIQSGESLLSNIMKRKQAEEQMQLQKQREGRSAALFPLQKQLQELQLQKAQMDVDPQAQLNYFRQLMKGFSGQQQAPTKQEPPSVPEAGEMTSYVPSIGGEQQPSDSSQLQLSQIAQNPLLRGFFKKQFGIDPASPQLSPSGDVANALYVEQLRQQYGENDPRYLQAKRAHESQLESRESLQQYRQQLGQTAPYRATSPLGKSIAEGQGRGALDMLVSGQQGADSGMPGEQGSGRPMDPQVQRAYEQEIAKKTTDPDARKRLLFARNIDKTLDTINEDDLTRYSGIQNLPKYIEDSSQATLGNAPDDYLKHQQAIESAAFLADQMRQFYGDSIQPVAMNRLRLLANPSTWYKNPKVSLAQFNQLKKILNMETETYKKAGTSPIKLDKPIIDYKDGEFVAVRPETNLKKANTKNSPSDENVDINLEDASKELIAHFPEATPENLRFTAKQTNKSIQDIIKELRQKAGIRQGAK